MATEIPEIETGIPKLTAKLAKILKQPIQKVNDIKNLADNFPGRQIKGPTSASPTVYVVGAGWFFPLYATALIAAGAKIVAYEMVSEKTGLGQIGLTDQDVYFKFQDISGATGLMPDFTQEQLARLPNVIREITEDSGYQEYLRKWRIAMGIFNKLNIPIGDRKTEYAGVDKSDRISKPELSEVKAMVLNKFKAAGALEIKHQEVTIDMVQSWLEENKPVFMSSGRQVNLKRMGVENLDGAPGFVKEFLLDTPDTSNVIDMIKRKQQDNKVPRIAVIGGGASARTCAKDLLNQVDHKRLELVRIRPEEVQIRQFDAPEGIEFELIRGYVSKLNLSRDNTMVESVGVVNAEGKAARSLRCDLLFHCKDQTFPSDLDESKANAFYEARDAIPTLQQKNNLGNVLVRYDRFFPQSHRREIQSRMTEPLVMTLNEDEALKEEIQKLVTRQKSEDVTIVVTGNRDAMVAMVRKLAASLGYQGKCVHVRMTPWAALDLGDELDRKKKECKAWREVGGRLVKDGTELLPDGTFSLGVRTREGEKVQGLPHVDAIINGAGKTKKTELVEDMIKKGYIIEEQGTIVANHPRLYGPAQFFPGPSFSKLTETLNITIFPLHGKREIDPRQWEEVFDSTLQMLDTL